MVLAIVLRRGIIETSIQEKRCTDIVQNDWFDDDYSSFTVCW